MDEARLEKMYEAFWPQMEAAFESIKVSGGEEEPKKGRKDTNTAILEEMLDLLRSQQMLLRNPEKILPVDYVEEILNQSVREREKSLKSVIPHRVYVDLRNAEMRLNRALMDKAEENEELYARIVAYTRDYIMAVNRLIKFVDREYNIYHDEN